MQNELSSYYLRVADDYRERYLETERYLIQVKESARRGQEEAVRKTEQRLTQIIEEEREEYGERLREREEELE